AFSILPLPGVLQPGQSQQVSSTLSGHLNTTCNVPELCHMEGGSTSEVLVPRAASRVSSSLSPQEINCGSQAPLRDRRELKEPTQKVEEEAKALEEEERQKKEKKSVSAGKQPPKPANGKTKTQEKKETKLPEKKKTKIPEKKETKLPEKKKTKIPEKKETKIPEKKEIKAPEKKETKTPERKETKAPKKCEPKIPEKKEPKAPKKRELKASKKGGTEIPEDPDEMENSSFFIHTTNFTQFDRPCMQL
ncbi:small proline-rich protein 3-like, partial [Zonotrichia leucophrys gambelii]|uniref:small proline-rich protein 3-like n=1 Tax=Zonotrichia leucophrys gambelii TaxID=257770 RepID=UPI0031401CFF